MRTQTTSPINTVEVDPSVLVRRAWADEKASAGTSLQRWMLIADYLAKGRSEHRGNVQFNRFLVAAGLDDMDPTTRADAIKLGKLLPLSEALISTLTEAGCAHPSVVLPRIEHAEDGRTAVRGAAKKTAVRAVVPYCVSGTNPVVAKGQLALRLLRKQMEDAGEDEYGPLRPHTDHADILALHQVMGADEPDYTDVGSWLDAHGPKGVARASKRREEFAAADEHFLELQSVERSAASLWPELAECGRWNFDTHEEWVAARNLLVTRIGIATDLSNLLAQDLPAPKW